MGAQYQQPALSQASAAATMTSSAAIVAGARFRDDSKSRGPRVRISRNNSKTRARIRGHDPAPFALGGFRKLGIWRAR